VTTTTHLGAPAENMLRVLKEQMNADLTKAAEPEIQRALAEVEKVMRQRLASHLIALLDRQFDMRRNGEDLVITLRGSFGGGK
jgi:formate dehydrogenase maturation protein FdhE